MSDRYIVVGVTGYPIIPGPGNKTGGSSKPATSYSVLDTVNCYREVERFYAKPNTVERIRKRKAERLAAELNQLEQQHEAQKRRVG